MTDGAQQRLAAIVNPEIEDFLAEAPPRVVPDALRSSARWLRSQTSEPKGFNIAIIVVFLFFAIAFPLVGVSALGALIVELPSGTVPDLTATPSKYPCNAGAIHTGLFSLQVKPAILCQ